MDGDKVGQEKRPVVALINVSYAYPVHEKKATPKNMALEKVSLTIKRGERVALIGPNGGGKTTLLHIIAGLKKPVGGKALVLGKNAWERDMKKTEVGLVFQDPEDQVFMPTVWEDVAFGPMNRGEDEKTIRERVETVLRLMGLEKLSHRPPHALSIGEKKRVALAGMLVMEPEILLLDEPTSNLDPRGKKEVIDFLQAFSGTLVVATHDIDTVPYFADRVVVLNRTILADGTPETVFSNAKLLEKAGLTAPCITRYFLGLGSEHAPPPLRVEDALERPRK